MLRFPLKKNARRKCVLHINVFVFAVVFRSVLPLKQQQSDEEAERQNYETFVRRQATKKTVFRYD